MIDAMHRRLVAALRALDDVDFEIVYVDDGSADATLPMLRRLHGGTPGVRVLALSRNFGHQIAVSAGIDAARGDAVAIIDADLQDPPELLGAMLDRWRDGVDVVYGQRASRGGESAFKLFTAKTFYRLLAGLTDIRVPLDTGDFRLLDRSVATALRSMPERDRFLRGMVAWAGFRQEALTYGRDARHAGATKYSLLKMVRLAMDGIASFSIAPLRIASWFGAAGAGLAFIGMIYALALRLLTDHWVSGWTLLFIAVLFLGGVQLAVIGVLGEYVGRIYAEAKRRPLYFVRERLDAPGDGAGGNASAG